MFRDELLENAYRRRIYHFINKNPGLHLRELQRRLDIPLSTLDYHLDYMVGKHVIERRRNGNYTRYYAESLEPSERKLLSILRQKQLRNILLRMVRDEAGVKYQTLLQRLRIPSSTLSFYLNQLVKSRIIIRHHVGREHIYTVANGDAIMKLLIMYQSSFIDRLIDNVIATWMELHHSPKGSE